MIHTDRIHRTNGPFFERALTNLNELQRDVRKEIYRSKNVCK